MQVQHAIQAFGAWLLQDQRLQLSEAPHSSQEDAQEDPAEPALAQKPAQLHKVAKMAQSGQFAGLVELQQAVQSALEAAHAEAVQSLKHKGPTFRSALTGFSDRCQGFACASDMARKLCGGLLGSLSSSCPQRLKAWSQRCDAACLAHKIPALSLVTLPPRTCNMVYPVPCSHVHHLHQDCPSGGSTAATAPTQQQMVLMCRRLARLAAVSGLQDSIAEWHHSTQLKLQLQCPKQQRLLACGQLAAQHQVQDQQPLVPQPSQAKGRMAGTGFAGTPARGIHFDDSSSDCD